MKSASAETASVEKSGSQLSASKTVGQLTATLPEASVVAVDAGADAEAGGRLQVADRIEVRVVEVEEQLGDADRVRHGRLAAGVRPVRVDREGLGRVDVEPDHRLRAPLALPTLERGARLERVRAAVAARLDLEEADLAGQRDRAADGDVADRELRLRAVDLDEEAVDRARRRRRRRRRCPRSHRSAQVSVVAVIGRDRALAVASVVFLTTWPRRGSLTPSVKSAPASVSVPSPPASPCRAAA